VTAPHTTAPLLAARDIVKRFPGVVAVDHLTFTLAEGEVIALLGQNGAGKSTVIQILAGVHPHGSYEGEITLRGRPFRATTASHAQALGVALVPQEVNVVPELTVAENMFLNTEPTRWVFLDEALRAAEARRILREFDVDVDPGAMMSALDLATQQLVAIARVLSMKAQILILDEPTAALTDHETERLFARMRALRARGVTFIFVSHRMGEVFAIADRILVMRDGRVAGEFKPEPTARDEVVRAMLGDAAMADHQSRSPHEASEAAVHGAPATTPRPTVLEVRDLVVRDASNRRRPAVSGVSLRLAEGEILGLFGLLGAGCSEVAQGLFGAWNGVVEGTILVNGREARIRHPADAIAHRIGLVAQDRRESLVHEHTIADNIVLAKLGAERGFGFLDLPDLKKLAVDFAKRLSIKANDVDTAVGTLSGGNQQKVQVARWLALGSKILLLVDPTRGIDIGARSEINKLWLTLADEGCALLLISSEAEELVDVCHRVLIMRNGTVSNEVSAKELTVERLLRLAAGA
jgi:ABC-type sugar transport system ATPase subunit